jgi:photosystem II stability/assembly factor-like uncharacterized protein
MLVASLATHAAPVPQHVHVAKEWKVITNDQLGAGLWCLGASAASDTVGWFAGADRDKQPKQGQIPIRATIYKTLNGANVTEVTTDPDAHKDFMFTDIAASKKTSKSVVAMGLTSAEYTEDDGATWHQADLGLKIPAFDLGQSIKEFDTSTYAIASAEPGAFQPHGGGGGILLSKDGGKTFTPLPIDHSVLDVDHQVRYSAHPTPDTWYVTAGQFPTPSPPPSYSGYRYDEGGSNDGSSEHLKHLTQQYSLRKDKETGRTFARYTPHPHAPTEPGVGYTATIAKTTDAGKTWTKVFSHDGEYYFNDISCWDADNCLAAAEAHNDNVTTSDGGYIFMTNDGGKTWPMVYRTTSGQYGMIGVRWTSATDAWASGNWNELPPVPPLARRLQGPPKMIHGRFWHTTDTGKTWTEIKLDHFAPMSMDCADDGHCVAAGFNDELQGGAAVLQ